MAERLLQHYLWPIFVLMFSKNAEKILTKKITVFIDGEGKDMTNF